MSAKIFLVCVGVYVVHVLKLNQKQTNFDTQQTRKRLFSICKEYLSTMKSYVSTFILRKICFKLSGVTGTFMLNVSVADDTESLKSVTIDRHKDF